MNSSEPIVHIVDDDNAIRDSLALLMKAINCPTKTYSSARMFLQDEEIYKQKMGCVLLDVRMPGMSGLDLLQEINERQIDLPVVILTGHADVTMAIRAMKNGAVDFFEKPFNEQKLLDCVQECIKKKNLDFEQHEKKAELAKRFSRLSKREREIMSLIVEGNSSKSIATQLFISPKTVDVHRAHIQQKLEVKNIADLVRFAVLTEENIFHM